MIRVSMCESQKLENRQPYPDVILHSLMCLKNQDERDYFILLRRSIPELWLYGIFFSTPL